MRRPQFLSSAFGGVAGGLPVAARSDPPHPRGGPEAAAPSAQTAGLGAPFQTFTHSDGREIHVEQFAVRHTYWGLAGHPYADDNAAAVITLKKFCKRAFAVKDSLILAPSMLPCESGGENWDAYPSIFVAALFLSSGRPHHLDGSFSKLVVGWFQSSLLPLFPDDTLTAIQRLDWRKRARVCWL
jgi:hypothetical protein